MCRAAAVMVVAPVFVMPISALVFGHFVQHASERGRLLWRLFGIPLWEGVHEYGMRNKAHSHFSWMPFAATVVLVPPIHSTTDPTRSRYRTRLNEKPSACAQIHRVVGRMTRDGGTPMPHHLT